MSPEDDIENSYVMIMYLIGLSISILGVLFEIVDKNKKLQHVKAES